LFFLFSLLANLFGGCGKLAADCCFAPWGAATFVREDWGNGPRVNGFDLADHPDQHLFFCRQDLVASGGSCGSRALYRRTTRAHLCADGSCFLAAQLSLGYISWRYREQPSSPPVLYSHGNTKLEIIWTVLTTILFVGLNLMGSTVWASQRFDPAGPGAVKVEVTGMQFAWYFRYPGPDGKYGATSPRLMDPSAGGEAAVGLNTSDPAAKDDLVTGTMYLPVDREVDLSLRSVDVIHSFFVPSLRFKQDAVPGLNIHMHFKPTAIGEYEIACAELCGLGHYKMHGMVHVVSQEDFDQWLAAREAEKQ